MATLPAVADIVKDIAQAYAFDGPALELGSLVVEGTAHPEAPVRVPLSMLNRHGLVAGATGTGKTKTLQLMAEQLSAAGVPCFLADIKGDLSGMAAPGASNDRITTRATEIGTEWVPTAYPVQFLTLGGQWAAGRRYGPPSPRSGRSCWPRCWASTTPRSPRWRWSSTSRTRPGCRCSTSRTCGRSSAT